MREFEVYVFNHYYKRGGKNRPLCYTRWQGGGACLHRVQAMSGDIAKRMAAEQHIANPACSQIDRFNPTFHEPAPPEVHEGRAK